VKPSLERRVMQRLQPFTRLVLFSVGENNFDTKGQLLQALYQTTATLAMIRAMLNDDNLPPTTTQGASNGEKPAKDESASEAATLDLPGIR